jgi:hypothetical protein
MWEDTRSRRRALTTVCLPPLYYVKPGDLFLARHCRWNNIAQRREEGDEDVLYIATPEREGPVGWLRLPGGLPDARIPPVWVFARLALESPLRWGGDTCAFPVLTQDLRNQAMKQNGDDVHVSVRKEKKEGEILFTGIVRDSTLESFRGWCASNKYILAKVSGYGRRPRVAVSQATGVPPSPSEERRRATKRQHPILALTTEFSGRGGRWHKAARCPETSIVKTRA